MIPCVSYMRCSGAGQINGDTWDRQRSKIATWAVQAGYRIVLEFLEEGVSGISDEVHRPAFQEMIAALLSNGTRTILIEGMDRLAREYRVQEQLIVYLASKGLKLIACNTGEDITEAMMGDPMRRALVQIQGVLAELDKNMIVAKLMAARKRKRARGERCEGRRPFGSKPGEAETLAAMKALASESHTYREIAEALNRKGLPTRMGRPWSVSSVQQILARVC